MKPTPSGPLKCLRCHVDLEYAGTKLFREGINWGMLGFFGELFEKSEAFHTYYCPNCGKMEFFLEKVGVKHRSK